jgi:hypothetical protein
VPLFLNYVPLCLDNVPFFMYKVPLFMNNVPFLLKLQPPYAPPDWCGGLHDVSSSKPSPLRESVGVCRTLNGYSSRLNGTRRYSTALEGTQQLRNRCSDECRVLQRVAAYYELLQHRFPTHWAPCRSPAARATRNALACRCALCGAEEKNWQALRVLAMYAASYTLHTTHSTLHFVICISHAAAGCVSYVVSCAWRGCIIALACTVLHDVRCLLRVARRTNTP